MKAKTRSILTPRCVIVTTFLELKRGKMLNNTEENNWQLRSDLLYKYSIQLGFVQATSFISLISKLCFQYQFYV